MINILLLYFIGKGIADLNSPYNNNLAEDILSLNIANEVKESLANHLDKNDDYESKKVIENDSGYMHRYYLRNIVIYIIFHIK